MTPDAVYTAFFETTPDGIMIVSDDGRYVDVNAAMCRILRAPRELLIGRHFSDFIPPERLSEAYAEFAMLQDDATLSVEFPVRAADGTIVNLEWRSRGNFVPGLHFCIARDLSARDAAEERYRAFIAHSSEAIWRFELEEPVPVSLPVEEQIDCYYRFGYLAECNDAMARMYGFERAADVTGARLGDMLVRDNPENVAFLRAFIESGYQLADAESVEIDRDGNAKYFRNNFTGHIENGAVVRAWGTQRDVTEQRRVEIALREREGHLSAIVRNVNVGIAEMDREGRFAFVNEQFCRLLGRSAEELRGMRMEGVTHPEDIPRNVEFIRALAARGGEDVIEKRYLRPDGTSVWARVVATVQRDESGAVTGMVGMIRDISAARAAEDERAMLLAAAQASEQRAMFLAGASAILGSSLDSDAMLTALADFIAKRFADACIIVVNGENGRIRRASGKAAVDTRLEIEMTIREGETQIGDGLAVVPVVAHAHVLGAIAFLRQQPFDDADLRIANDLGRRAGLAFDNARVYRELDRANRAKDDFLAILSHEMRTPMTAILGWASMLQIGSMSDETTRTAVDTIVQSTRAQAKLIDDLLDVSRIVTGKMQIAMQPISVHSPLAAAVETVRPAAEAKQIAIHIDDAAAGAQVSGDAARLQQVFWNILSNAVKFTPRFGAIDIAVSATEEGVLQVVVRDDGDGIDPDFLPYLFDRFRQADSTATRKHGGLGLGLSIARNLTELHGGTLHAESEGIGKGASFRVTLPLVAPSTAAIKPSRVRREAEIPLDGMRILLVEDDDATRTMLEAALRRYGADARSVSNVGDAMATLDGSDFDVVLSDIGLPGEDGYALLQKIRRSGERLRKLPAVALTAYARGGDRERAIAAGFQSYLAKPVDPAKLAEELRRVAITPPAS